jgi:hypothetical protein
MPGPVPWQNPEDIEGLRRDLLPSEFDRLVLNIWSESESRAIAPEDYEIAAQDPIMREPPPSGLQGGTHRLRNYGPHQYIITVDVGIKNDATVILVAHREQKSENNEARMVVDHIDRWAGRRLRHVQVEEVIERVTMLASEYHANVHADPHQFAGGIQELNRRGISAEEWVFSAQSVGQLAGALVRAFKNAAILLPDYEELREELLSVRLQENSNNVARLVHDSSGHDDQAVAIGMAAAILLDAPRWSQAHAFMEFWKTESEKPSVPHVQPSIIDRLKYDSVSPIVCYTPRYGPEGTCLHCNKSPLDHPREGSGIIQPSP